MDWVFAFHSVQVGMSLGGACQVCGQVGALHELLCVAADPCSYCLLAVGSAWLRGWGHQKRVKLGKPITRMRTEYVSHLKKSPLFPKFTILSRVEFARTWAFSPARACV